MNDEAETDGALALEPDPEPGDEDGELLPQAAAVILSAAAPAVTASLAVICFNETTLFS